MTSFILKRILRGFITFMVAATITFLILRLMPSNPVSIMVDPRMTQVQIDQLMHDFGLDKPYLEQYLIYMKNIFTGDLGVSFSSKQPVINLLMARLPWTVLLLLCVLANNFIWGIPLGVLSAYFKNTWIDRVINIFIVIGTSIFVPSLGITLLYFFGVKYPLLPIGGSRTPGVGGGLAYILDVTRHLILPVLTLTIVNLANYVLYMRASMIDIMNQDYIRTARSKGMKESRVIWRHGVRNGLIPTVTMTGLLISTMVGGSILTESVFSYPGIGRLIYESVNKLDYPVLQGAFLTLSLTVIIVGIITDLIYAKLDPRIKLD